MIMGTDSDALEKPWPDSLTPEQRRGEQVRELDLGTGSEGGEQLGAEGNADVVMEATKYQRVMVGGKRHSFETEDGRVGGRFRVGENGTEECYETSTDKLAVNLLLKVVVGGGQGCGCGGGRGKNGGAVQACGADVATGSAVLMGALVSDTTSGGVLADCEA